MYDIAKKARSGMKAKAERLAGEKDRKTDSSDWSPAEPLNADVKTGMRPVSRRAYKKGGAVKGEVGKPRADRKPRKAGGSVETKGEQPLVDRYINRDLKKANEYRDGTKHVGGMKKGGRIHKDDGGEAGSKRLTPDAKAKISEALGPRVKGNLLREGTGSARAMIGLAKTSPKNTGRQSIDLPDYGESLTSSGLRRGGRAKKADGGSMSMEEMIKKNPAPKKADGFKMPNPVPLPPRRQEEPIKYKKDTDLTTQGYKKGGAAGEKWIQKAIKKPGALHKQLGVKEGEKIPAKKLEKAAEKGGKLGKRARLAQTLRSMHKDGGKVAEKACYGGKMKKADGGPAQSDPRLGIVSPKAMSFAQNLVTPGLKKGGRVKKEVGGAAAAAGPAAIQALSAPVNIAPPPNAGNLPAVGSGLLPSSGSAVTPGPVWDPSKYEKGSGKGRGRHSESSGYGSDSGSSVADKISDMRSEWQKGVDKYARPQGAKKGGRVAKADGGSLMMGGKHKAKSAKGKTNINIIIATGKKDDQQPMMPPPAGAGAPPMPPMPPMGAGGPPPMGGMPPMGPPPMGAGAPKPPMPMPPMARKEGGRVTKVAKSYKDMEAGAASGEGRLQKTDIAKRIPKPAFEKGLTLTDKRGYPNKVLGATGGRTAHKAGGKVYRSYKDMDAGAGSGTGRLEKTEIQSRKK